MTDDYISRQVVLDSFWKLDIELRPCAIDAIVNMINNLPPVIPKEKTGKWYSTTIQGQIDGQIVKAFVCSECGAISVFRLVDGEIVNGDLCPNCGCQMVKPQESEGKE